MRSTIGLLVVGTVLIAASVVAAQNFRQMPMPDLGGAIGWLNSVPTPGSVIIFVTLPSGTRYAFVGDLVWQLEGITQREERPWITRRRADTDAKANRENLLRMIALKERLPELIIVPAHDMRAFAEMPRLSSMTASSR